MAEHSHLITESDDFRVFRILRWFQSRIANGLIEGINSLVQAAKAKARGYRSLRNLKAITYPIAGRLDLRLPT